MAEETFLFVDFDNTMVDTERLRSLYTAELARILASDYGGDENRWAAAIPPALDACMARYVATFEGRPLAGYCAWLPEEMARIAAEVFTGAGVAAPAGVPLSEVAQRAQFDALAACNAAIEGAEDALRTLFDRGVRTQVASAQDSEYLLAALIGSGLESYTESKFGPDLIDCAKEGPEFYQRMFDQVGVEPSRAIVLDDLPTCLRWAEEAGAKVVQACLLPASREPAFPHVLRRFSYLPELVEKLGAQ